MAWPAAALLLSDHGAAPRGRVTRRLTWDFGRIIGAPAGPLGTLAHANQTLNKSPEAPPTPCGDGA